MELIKPGEDGRPAEVGPAGSNGEDAGIRCFIFHFFRISNLAFRILRMPTTSRGQGSQAQKAQTTCLNIMITCHHLNRLHGRIKIYFTILVNLIHICIEEEEEEQKYLYSGLRK